MRLGRKKLVGLIILILILISSISFYFSSIYILFGNNIEVAMKSKFGLNYPKVLNYEYINIGSFNIADIDYYKPTTKIKVKNSTTKQGTVNNIINFLNTIPYTYGQNNPNLYKEGLDCQGYSLLMQELCEKNNIKCTIGYTSDHMFNYITLDNKVYKVDITNKIMKEV